MTQFLSGEDKHWHDVCLARLNRAGYESLYDQQHGIHPTGDFQVTETHGDVEFLEQPKSDGSHTLATMSRCGHRWVYNIPTENQIYVFSEILPRYYAKLNRQNEAARGR